MRARVIGLLCLLVLAACRGQPAEPTPLPVLLPLHPLPTANVEAPANAMVQGLALPGRLLFGKSGDLWLWQGETGNQLTHAGDVFQPAWSPDGSKIAFVQRGESYSDLMMMAADGSAVRRLTNHGSSFPPHSYERIYDTMWAFYPAFSPDGTTIAFASQYGPPAGSPAADYHLSLFSVPAGGGASKSLLYGNDQGHVGRLVYASDGRSIIFAYGPVALEPPQLYRYDLASGAGGPWEGLPEQSYDPVVSPNGRWLAFAARDAGRTDIFAVPLGGGAPVRLTSLGTARSPAFSPDGRWLAFLAIAPDSHGFDLWVAELQEAQGGALSALSPRQVTQNLGIDADSGLAWGD